MSRTTVLVLCGLLWVGAADPRQEQNQSLFELPLDFVPSDFIPTDDGKHLVALNRGKGEAVVVSLADRKVIRTFKVGGEPCALVQAGNVILIGGRTSSDLHVIETDGFNRVDPIPLQHKTVFSIVATRDADPPRVFVLVQDHILEVDPVGRKVVHDVRREMGERPHDPTLTVTPRGERLYMTIGSGASIWNISNGRLERESRNHTVRGDSPIVDGQGQYLVSTSEIYDQHLNVLAEFRPFLAEIAVHPGLPYAVCFDLRRCSLRALDLHELAYKEEASYSGSVRNLAMDRGLGMRIRIFPDAGGVFVGGVQHDNSKTDLEKPASIYALPLPRKKAAGYFAFTSITPGRAWVRFPLSYKVRLSEPFSASATIRMETDLKGVKWNEDERELTWTPELPDAGKRRIVLHAKDPDGGPEISQTLQLNVQLRHVLDEIRGDDIRLTNDQKYLYALRPDPLSVRVYDLDRNVHFSFPLKVKPKLHAYTGGRLYWTEYVGPDESDRVVSCRMEDGSDVRQHDAGPLTPVDFRPRGRTDEMLLIVKDLSGRSSMITLAGKSPVTVALLGREPDYAYISPDGKHLVGNGALMKWTGKGFKEIRKLDWIRFIWFSHDSKYALHEGEVHKFPAIKATAKWKDEYGRFDPTGPFLPVKWDQGIEILRFPSFARRMRVEIGHEALGGMQFILVGQVIPLSGRNVILLEGRTGYFIFPCKF